MIEKYQAKCFKCNSGFFKAVVLYKIINFYFRNRNKILILEVSVQNSVFFDARKVYSFERRVRIFIFEKSVMFISFLYMLTNPINTKPDTRDETTRCVTKYYLGESNWICLLYGQSEELFWVGRSVGTKNHQVKETSATMSTQVTYETNHISSLCDSTKSSATNFRFHVFYCSRKEKDHIRRNINSEKKKKYLYVKSLFLLFWYAQNKSGLGPCNKKLSCLRLITNHIVDRGFLNTVFYEHPSPYITYPIFFNFLQPP